MAELLYRHEWRRRLVDLLMSHTMTYLPTDLPVMKVTELESFDALAFLILVAIDMCHLQQDYETAYRLLGILMS